VHVDVDEEEEASQADDGSMTNVLDSGHCTSKYDDWTVYFRHEKYNHCEANATARKYDNGQVNSMASNVSEAKAALQ
jgi:hypothetical protein